jgi:hypothetical protein
MTLGAQLMTVRVVSLTDNSIGVNYDCNIFITLATGACSLGP